MTADQPKSDAANRTPDRHGGATAAFASLKLPGHWRKHTPPNFVGLDRVLDEVGRRAYPAEWGRLPGWDLLPFRHDRRRNVYRGGWGLRLVEGSPRTHSKPLVTDHGRTKLRACERAYRNGCDRVMVEFEAGRLTPYGLHRPWGDVEKITTAGLWATQGEWAFYAGLVVVPGRYGAPVTARVLVRTDDLDRWTRQHDSAGTAQAATEGRQRVGRTIRDFMAETKCRVTQALVRELCEAVMGQGALRSKQALADVWNAIPSAGGGRPKNVDRSAIVAHREALQLRIAQAWVSRPESPAQT